jgi:hypothetical protein
LRRFVSISFALFACSNPQPVASTTKPIDTPKLVDSHVHLAYYPVASALAEHGIVAAVDLAAPESALGKAYPLRVIQSGPMLTRPNGYPLDSWGKDGFGIGCADPACVTSAIDRLANKGARVIKIALDDNGLEPRLAAGATMYAHRRGLRVAVHALSDEAVRTAAEIHADVLAHTPLEPLSAETILAWHAEAQHGTHAVISTLVAFGGGDVAISNLGRLRAAGLTVLYGTDLGNLRVDGPSQEEIALLKRAGLSDDEVTAAMTAVPWRFWGFDE